MAPKFEHKLRRHTQRFGKIAATVVSDKNENLLSSGFQRHRSCHRNEMTLLPVLLAEVYVGTGNCSAKIVHGNFFLQKRPRFSWSLSEICKSVIRMFWGELFMVRNTVKSGQSWCSAVICRKRGAFDMQFHLIVVSIFLKTCVKDHGDNSSRFSLLSVTVFSQWNSPSLGSSLISLQPGMMMQRRFHNIPTLNNYTDGRHDSWKRWKKYNCTLAW